MTEPQPPAGNPDHRPYGAPPQGPQQQPYGVPPQPTAPLPQYGRPQPTGTPPQHTAHPPQHAGPPQQHGQPQHGPPPQHGQPRYGQAPHTAHPPQYGQAPQYGQPQYGQPPPQQYAGPQYSNPPQYPGSHQPPRKPSKAPWLLIGGIAVVLLLLTGTVVFVTTRGTDDTADAEVPTATYSDSVTSPSTQPSTTAQPTTEPPSPSTPTTPPPVGERRRTLKDLDLGIHVYDDIYVTPAPGWRKTDSTKQSVILETSALPGAVLVAVSPAGWPARVGVAQAVDEMIAADRMKGVKKGAVRTMPPANSNVGAQAEQQYSGRVTAKNGVVVSLVARCTTLTGVETVHNVTVTVCVAAGRNDRPAVFKAADRMLASVARSI